jgi:hypothetical protein
MRRPLRARSWTRGKSIEPGNPQGLRLVQHGALGESANGGSLAETGDVSSVIQQGSRGAQPCQGWGRGFESLRPLQLFKNN